MSVKSRFPIPGSVMVKGVKYTVKQKLKLKDDDGRIVAGLHDHTDKVIWLDKAMGVYEKRDTFLHELIHAYIYECHAREGLDPQLEEVLNEIVIGMLREHFVVRWKK